MKDLTLEAQQVVWIQPGTHWGVIWGFLQHVLFLDGKFTFTGHKLFFSVDVRLRL